VQQLERLEAESHQAGFWSDQREAQDKMRQINDLRERVTTWQTLAKQADDALEMVTMSADEKDESLLAELQQEAEALAAAVEKLEFQLALSGPHDKASALLSIHAGAGGTESQDWVEMLMRMYLRWAEQSGYKTFLIDQTEGEEAGLKSVTLEISGEEAGLKSVTLEISGEYVYGYLKAERGVHRLVRLSPFDAAKRRHTSFALVEAVPNIETDIEIEIKPEDIETDVYKSGGAGGQHVQKNSTAIRLRHLPTGLVVTCQNERSQLQNREMAMRILRGRLYDLELQKQESEQARLKGEHVEAGWGNQIRSYVLHPYKMVKDHRTSFEVGNAEGVLDGNLNGFINAYLRYNIGQMK